MSDNMYQVTMPRLGICTNIYTEDGKVVGTGYILEWALGWTVDKLTEFAKSNGGDVEVLE